MDKDLPAYFFDKKLQSSILTESNIQREHERNIFHLLCTELKSRNSQMMEFSLFVEIASRSIDGLTSVNTAHHTKTLLETLKKEHYGLLMHSYTKEEGASKADKQPGRIILDSHNGGLFFQSLVNEEYLSVLSAEDRDFRFLTNRMFEQAGISFPAQLSRQLGFKDISSKLLANENEIPVLLLKYQEERFIVLSQTVLDQLIGLSRRKIAALCLDNSKLMDYIVRTTNSSITHIKEGLKSRNPRFWLDICSLFINKKKEMEAGQIKLDNSFFLSALIISHYERNERGLKEEANRQAKHRAEDMDKIQIQIKEANIVKADKLSEILKKYKAKYKDEFNDFIKDFFDKRVNQGNETLWMPIIKVGESYIHQDRIFSEFRKRLDQCSDKLFKEFVGEMFKMLNKKEPKPYFHKVDLFQKEIISRIDDDFLRELLKLPFILFQAVEHNYSKNSARILPQFFNSKGTEFLPPEKLFNLDLQEICRNAYSNLHPLKQFWRRIVTGSYKKELHGFKQLMEGTKELIESAKKEKSLTAAKGQSLKKSGPVKKKESIASRHASSSSLYGRKSTVSAAPKKRIDSALEKKKREAVARKQLDASVEELKSLLTK